MLFVVEVLFLQFFWQYLFRMFTDDPQLNTLAELIFPYFLLCCGLDYFSGVLNGIIRGIGK